MRFSDLRQYRPKPDQNVFTLGCEDEFVVEEFRKVWAGSLTGNWVFEKMHAKEFEEIEFNRFMDEALTPSLFSQSRVLLIRNAEKITKGRAEDLGALKDVPNSSLKCILVINLARDASGFPRKLPEWARAFPLVEVDPLLPAEAGRWLMDRYGVSADVARYIVESAGTDLYPLHNEMEKLRTYIGSDRPIDIRDVDASILRAEKFGPFELDDAILAHNYKKAVHVVGMMLDEGMEPLLILSKIVRVWRQLFIGKGLAGKNGANQVAAGAGVPSFKANDFLNGCRKYSWKQLAGGFRELLYADRAFKSSNPNVEAYFDILLWKLVG